MLTVTAAVLKTPPYDHQLYGVNFIINRPWTGVLDEMGAGKTKQAVDAACAWFNEGLVDTVVVVCPAAVKHSWKDLEFGEVVKHHWVPSWIGEYGAITPRLLAYDSETKKRLYWVITNYEFIRSDKRLSEFIKQLRGRKVAIYADESAFIKTPRAAQTRAALKVRDFTSRALILNGTPIANTLLDLYSQMEFLSPSILGVKNFWHFRAKYALLGGFHNKQILGYQNIEDLIRRIKPHVLRRLKKDCLDLPEKIYNPPIQVALSPTNWAAYKSMRDDMLAEMKDIGTAVTMHSVVRLLRLGQITSGFIGGVDGDDPGEIHEIGQEKLEATKYWAETNISENVDFRGIVWSRFRPEQQRLSRVLPEYGHVVRIYGGQREDERRTAIQEFTAGTRKGPVFLLGQPQAGGYSLNLITSYNALYTSNDYNLLTRLQSEDRIDRIGQLNHPTYTDLLATGPNGQKTIDHTIYRALRRKEDFAKWTTDHWVSALMDGEDPTHGPIVGDDIRDIIF